MTAPSHDPSARQERNLEAAIGRQAAAIIREADRLAQEHSPRPLLSTIWRGWAWTLATKGPRKHAYYCDIQALCPCNCHQSLSLAEMVRIRS